MKWPWKKLEDRTATAIVNLKAMLETKIAKAIEIDHAMIMGQLNIFKNSEQIKYNRLEVRLNALEGCFKESLLRYQKSLEDQENRAALDAEK